MGDLVRLDRDGDVAVATIDRPEARNAMSIAAMRELDAIIDAVASGPERVFVLTGGGERAFVSGGDLKELSLIRTIPEAVEMADTMRSTLDRLATLPVPVIAAINGHAYGGGAEVAVAADIRIAACDVELAFNQITLGITPAWGGIERLTALVGRSRALLLMTSGDALSADDAFAWGLVDRSVARAGFESAWRDLAERIARAPRDALVGIKATQQRAEAVARPELAEEATHAFARAWVADAHWRMVDEAAARRRARAESTQ